MLAQGNISNIKTFFELNNPKSKMILTSRSILNIKTYLNKISDPFMCIFKIYIKFVKIIR